MSRSLLTYAFRRVLLAIPLIIILSFVVFALVHLIPGDPVRYILGGEEYDQTLAKQIREFYHLNDPIPVQYVLWAKGILQGSMGYTMATKRPVAQIVREAMGVTFSLALGGFLVTILLGVPAGIIAAVNKDTWKERAVLMSSYFGISVPGFLLALLMIVIFSVKLRWFPSFGYTPYSKDPLQWLEHLVLPSVAVGLLSTAWVARMVRSSLLDVLDRDYILTARSKGVFEQLVIIRHALANALIPVVTILGLQFGGLLGGAVIIETVFAMPGLGRTALQAISTRDFPVIQVCVLLISVIYITANLVTDLLYAVIDPRIRYR